MNLLSLLLILLGIILGVVVGYVVARNLLHQNKFNRDKLPKILSIMLIKEADNIKKEKLLEAKENQILRETSRK